jgi:hypothetical protein
MAAAAAAAHHEPSRDYDGAAAESLIDRIGAEMDKRVDARPRAGSSVASPLAKIPAPGSRELWAGVRVGAGITGTVALVAADSSHSNAVITAVLVVWAILAAATLGAALVRMYRVYRARQRG